MVAFCKYANKRLNANFPVTYMHKKPDDFRHPAFQFAESEVSSENAIEWLVLAIFRIEVTTDLLSV